MEPTASATLLWRVGACPGPPQFGGAPITNIRNVGSPHWRGWLGKHNRCIVPATSFCEYADTKPRKTQEIRYTLGDDPAQFAFRWYFNPVAPACAGRRARQFDGQHELFGYITTNKECRSHSGKEPKAMPGVLTT